MLLSARCCDAPKIGVLATLEWKREIRGAMYELA
jgi:hypothetical protein